MQNTAQMIHVYGRELARSIFDLMNTRMYGRSPSAEMAKVVEDELGHQRKRKIREQNSYGLDQFVTGCRWARTRLTIRLSIMTSHASAEPELYVRLPGEYPVVRLKLKYRKVKKHHPGLMARNIRDVLSPELEKVIQENERAASAAGLTFPTGDEVLEGAGSGAAAATATAGTAPQPVVVEVKKTILPEPVQLRSQIARRHRSSPRQLLAKVQ